MRQRKSAAPMPAMLARREATHRQRVLLGLATLLVLSISPVFGHHLIGAVSWLPASLEHLGPFCVIALHHLLAPVHGLFHILLFVGIAFTAVERSRAAWRHATTMRALPIESATSDLRLVTAIGRVGFAVDRVRVVAGLPNPAFTSGWISPRVYVAKSLPDLLNADELEAVLAHEVAHVRRRDPLRLFALRSLAATLFWLPAIRKLVDDLADEAEIAADDFAAQRYRLPLRPQFCAWRVPISVRLNPPWAFNEPSCSNGASVASRARTRPSVRTCPGARSPPRLSHSWPSGRPESSSCIRYPRATPRTAPCSIVCIPTTRRSATSSASGNTRPTNRARTERPDPLATRVSPATQNS